MCDVGHNEKDYDLKQLRYYLHVHNYFALYGQECNNKHTDKLVYVNAKGARHPFLPQLLFICSATHPSVQ